MKLKASFRLTAAILAIGITASAAVFPTLAEAVSPYSASPNLAVNASGTSNGFVTERPDSYANDGDYNTRWQSNIAVNKPYLESEASYTLDFNEKTAFDKVIIAWEDARPEASSEGYTLLYSNDGKSWNELSAQYTYDEISVNDNGENVHTDIATLNTPIAARYLKVSMFKMLDKYSPSIFEIEVYNVSGKTVSEDFETSYYVDEANKYIRNVKAEVGIEEFKNNFQCEITLDAKGQYIATGDSVKFDNILYTVVIKGDTSGDGKLNSTDFMQIRKYFLGTAALNGAKLDAADVNSDGKINSTDFMQVRKHFLGTYDIFGNIKLPDTPDIDISEYLMNCPSSEAAVGEMLYLTASPASAKVLCDNSGMSGIEAPNHMIAAVSSAKENQQSIVTESMYLSVAPAAITFDIGHIEAVGGIFIWNYNDTAKLNSGMKDIKISYSTDGKTYTELGQFTLAKCSSYDNAKYGGNVATNTTENNYAIDMNGIPARYVRITPLSNYGGSGYGLSEVRIFRHKETPQNGDMINAEGICQNTDLNASNAANNTGISVINGTVNSNETVSNNPNDMWLSKDTAANSAYILNLDGTYPIDKLKLWNYNDPNSLKSGIKKFTLYITTSEACLINQVDGGQDTLNFAKGNWTNIGTYTIPQGTGKDGMPASLVIDLSGKHAQHIKLVPVSNYGNSSDGYGLSEIRAYAGNGWAIEADRTWSGLLSSSGTFKYQGNWSSNPLGDSDNGSGWLGGDGVFSTPADDNTVLFTFQDSFIGNYGNYTHFDPNNHGYGYTPGFNIVNMTNMAYAVLNGSSPDPRNFQMYYRLNGDLSNGYPSGNIYPERFWLADSTVIDNVIYVIAGQVSNGWGNGVFDLYKHSLNADGSYNMDTSPSEVVDGTVNHSIAGSGDRVNEYSFNSIFDTANDGYIYLYGEIQINGKKSLGVARVAEENFTSMKNVTYWTGRTWSANVNDTAAISDFIPGGESNVTYMSDGPFAGKYVHIGTENGGYGSIFGTVVIAVSDSLTGPFKRPDEYKLYWAPERYQIYQGRYAESDNYYYQWNYNAKAHPAISENNELYITYHFGLHDDRVPSFGYFGAVAKEYEHASFIRMFEIE